MQHFRKSSIARSMKRHRQWEEDPNHEEQNAFEDAGEHFRDLLIRLHVEKGLEAVHITGLAYWHTMSGGTGAGDLALKPGGNPSNSNRKLKLGLGRDFADPELTYVDSFT